MYYFITLRIRLTKAALHSFAGGFFVAKTPMQLTPKQENFCLKYLETGNASEAYRFAYEASKMKPESVNRMAKELLDNLKITSRLKELSLKAVERHEITVDTLIDELEQARAAAMIGERPQVSAAVAATMGKAKLLGLGVDKHELTGANGGAIKTQDLTDDDTRANALALRLESVIAARANTSA